MSVNLRLNSYNSGFFLIQNQEPQPLGSGCSTSDNKKPNNPDNTVRGPLPPLVPIPSKSTQIPVSRPLGQGILIKINNPVTIPTVPLVITNVQQNLIDPLRIEDVVNPKVAHILKLCRLCGRKIEKKAINIFNYPKVPDLKNKINSLLPIKIEPNDGLPSVACKDCVHHVTMWDSFYGNVLQVEQILKFALEDPNLNPDDIDLTNLTPDNMMYTKFSHNDPEEAFFRCKQCKMKLYTKSESFEHSISGHYSFKNIFMCAICENAFDSRAKLQSHLNKTHCLPEEKCRFRCRICLAFFEKRSLYENHECSYYKKFLSRGSGRKSDGGDTSETNAEILKREMSCKVCGEHFKFKNILKRHQILCAKKANREKKEKQKSIEMESEEHERKDKSPTKKKKKPATPTKACDSAAEPQNLVDPLNLNKSNNVESEPTSSTQPKDTFSDQSPHTRNNGNQYPESNVQKTEKTTMDEIDDPIIIDVDSEDDKKLTIVEHNNFTCSQCGLIFIFEDQLQTHINLNHR